ncbi:MAG: transketolase [Clostridia bacterium]|nr:transketolase [Clostridia bacterium]
MDYKELESFAKEIRVNIVSSICSIGAGHIGGSLSIVEALTLLYKKHMKIDPANPKMEGRDRFVCSKGHAGPAVYAVLAEMGYFEKSELLTLNQGGTRLPSHCDMNKTPGIDMTAGSLGQGMSCAVGIALGAKLKKDGARCYCIIGDGESQEGQIWEAALFAAHKKLDNLIVFTDYNKYQLDGAIEEINNLEPLAEKWKAFGWNVYEVDGNCLEGLDKAIIAAKANTGKPSMIVMHTIKGKGIEFVESAKGGCHSMSVSCEQRDCAVNEIRGGLC